MPDSERLHMLWPLDSIYRTEISARDIWLIHTERTRRGDAVGRNRTGVLEFAVLGLLHRAPMHGYELRKQLRMLLGTFRALSYGTLYPFLNRTCSPRAVPPRGRTTSSASTSHSSARQGPTSGCGYSKAGAAASKSGWKRCGRRSRAPGNGLIVTRSSFSGTALSRWSARCAGSTS